MKSLKSSGAVGWITGIESGNHGAWMGGREAGILLTTVGTAPAEVKCGCADSSDLYTYLGSWFFLF